MGIGLLKLLEKSNPSFCCNITFFSVLPVIETTRQRYTVIEGRELDLPCRVTGVPKPTLTWLKNGSPIDENDYRYRVLHDGRLAVPITRLV